MADRRGALGGHRLRGAAFGCDAVVLVQGPARVATKNVGTRRRHRHRADAVADTDLQLFHERDAAADVERRGCLAGIASDTQTDVSTFRLGGARLDAGRLYAYACRADGGVLSAYY